MELKNKVLDSIATRHGIKEPKKVVPGSDEDKTVDLSAEGKTKCREQGSQIIKPDLYNDIKVTSSDFLRAMRTAESMLSGARYITNMSQYTTRADLGLGGKNWGHPRVPPYGNDKAVADAFISRLLTELYFNKGDGAPVMSESAFATTDALVQAIENALPAVREGKKELIVLATHAGLIDSLDSALYGTLQVNKDCTISLVNFPGSYAMGEYISGSAVDLDKPTFRFTAQGREVVRTLDGLKHIRDAAYEHSQRRY